ncbi:RNA-binding protein 39-like protein Caper isoform X1 [Rhodnius prolixus]|uniref:RRM domain-containing protein n=2 Tax=Rhodnius TaxID=13248 RepID=T1HXL9_RHOPR
MAEDFVEAMLEAPYKKGEETTGSRSHKENGTSSSHKSSSKKKDRERSRSREKRHSSRERRKKSRSREKKRSKSRERKRRSSRSRSRDRPRRKRSLTPLLLPGRKEPYVKYRKSPPLGIPPLDDLSPEERDARTVFCMQLSQRVRARDLEEFFSSVGKVRDVRLITCNKTRRFKGIAYIEFKDPESVPLALGLTGQKLLGVPIIVQQTQAEKNRTGNSMPNLIPRGMPGPMRLYIGSLHFNITEDMLRGIFEPFGKIDSIQLMTDPETGRSKGYGFLTFHHAEDAKRALEQLNGFELAGRPMKVGTVTERMDLGHTFPTHIDTDELDRSGIDLGATGRLQLMFKLAEGTGMQIPAAAASALNVAVPGGLPATANVAPPIATQCFMLSNMFDPATETNPSWDVEIRDDVIEECNKHGGVLHVYVDRASAGNVYVKCPTITTAVAAVNSLHGRWFAGRVITAAYVPLINYHSLFPDTMTSTTLLATRRNV